MKLSQHHFIWLFLVLSPSFAICQCNVSKNLDVVIREFDAFSYPKLQARLSKSNIIFNLTLDQQTKRYKGKLPNDISAASATIVIESKDYVFTNDQPPEMDTDLNGGKCVVFLQMKATKMVSISFDSYPRRIKLIVSNSTSVIKNDTTEFSYAFQIGSNVSVIVKLSDSDERMCYKYPISFAELIANQGVIMHKKEKIAKMVADSLEKADKNILPSNGVNEKDFFMETINSRLKKRKIKFVSFTIKQ